MQGEIWKVISLPPCMRTLVVEGTLGHARWTRGEIWKVISYAPCMRTLVVEGTLGHARWMRGEIWKDISHVPRWSWHLVMLDGRKVKFEKSSRMTWCENFAIRCYLFDVPRTNEEDLQEFPLIYLSHVISSGHEVTFEKSSCVHLTLEFWCAWSC